MVREATSWLEYSSIIHIPWLENCQADGLSELASSSADNKSKTIQWDTLTERSIEPREIMWLDQSLTWMQAFVTYLTYGTLPSDTKEVERTKKGADLFILYEEILYKRSYKCATPEMGE